MADGAPFYGAIGASLTNGGDTSPAAALAVTEFPSTGSYTYTRTFDLDPNVVANLQKGTAVLVVHGVDYNNNGTYDDVLGASELDPTLPAEATDPALCGAFTAMQMSGVPSGAADTGGGSTATTGHGAEIGVGVAALLAVGVPRSSRTVVAGPPRTEPTGGFAPPEDPHVNTAAGSNLNDGPGSAFRRKSTIFAASRVTGTQHNDQGVGMTAPHPDPAPTTRRRMPRGRITGSLAARILVAGIVLLGVSACGGSDSAGAAPATAAAVAAAPDSAATSATASASDPASSAPAGESSGELGTDRPTACRPGAGEPRAAGGLPSTIPGPRAVAAARVAARRTVGAGDRDQFLAHRPGSQFRWNRRGTVAGRPGFQTRLVHRIPGARHARPRDHSRSHRLPAVRARGFLLPAVRLEEAKLAAALGAATRPRRSKRFARRSAPSRDRSARSASRAR